MLAWFERAKLKRMSVNINDGDFTAFDSELHLLINKYIPESNYEEVIDDTGNDQTYFRLRDELVDFIDELRNRLGE